MILAEFSRSRAEKASTSTATPDAHQSRIVKAAVECSLGVMIKTSSVVHDQIDLMQLHAADQTDWFQ